MWTLEFKKGDRRDVEIVGQISNIFGLSEGRRGSCEVQGLGMTKTSCITVLSIYMFWGLFPWGKADGV